MSNRNNNFRPFLFSGTQDSYYGNTYSLLFYSCQSFAMIANISAKNMIWSPDFLRVHFPSYNQYIKLEMKLEKSNINFGF